MSTEDKLREIWSRKIESYAAFTAATEATHKLGISTSMLSECGVPRLSVHNLPQGSVMKEDVWPLLREMNRERYGVYPEPTPVLLAIRTVKGMAGQYFPHVSPADPTMVAYTPDRPMAIADRQVRTTPGKLIRKFFPYISDNEVSSFEKAHRAALDDSFEIATTADEIERIYRTMRGDTACMRHDKSYFGLDVHPSAVYEAPGMGVAYLQDDEGTPTARSVIWVNPDNENDKRYVRLYGDALLATKLQRKGFRLAGLAGAKIRAIPQPDSGPNYYAVPYLDRAGGGASGHDDTNIQGLVRYEGEDYFRLLTKLQFEALSQVGARLGGALGGGSGAKLILRETPRDPLVATCVISGKQIDRLVDPTIRWMQPDGTVGWALTGEVVGTIVPTRAAIAGELTTVCCTPETRETLCLDFLNVKNDPESIRLAGYVKLSSRFYPTTGLEGYAVVGEAQNMGTTEEPDWISNSDAIRILDVAEGKPAFRHTSELKQLREEGYVSVSPLDNLKCMVHKDSSKLVHLAGSGRASVIGFHNIVKLFDGTYAPVRRAINKTICGVSFVIHEDVHAGLIELPQEVVDSSFQGFKHIDSVDRLRNYCTNHASNSAFGVGPFYVADGRIAQSGVYNYSRSALTYESIKAAATQIVENRANEEWLDANVSSHTSDKRGAVGWAVSVLRIYTAFETRIDELTAPAPTPTAPAATDERFSLAA